MYLLTMGAMITIKKVAAFLKVLNFAVKMDFVYLKSARLLFFSAIKFYLDLSIRGNSELVLRGPVQFLG